MIKRILILLPLFISNNVLAQEAEWLNSRWDGYVGYEHDTTQYKISFNFQDSIKTYQVYFEDVVCNKFKLNIDSLNQNFVRFSTPSISDQTKPCLPSNFKIELLKSNSPNVLFVQYNWWNDELWLGQVSK